MAKTKRQARLDALACKIQQLGLQQNRNIVDDIADMNDPEAPGVWVRRKQARRVSNVFETLFKSGRINGAEREAAGNMAELFAKSRGLYSVSERSLERVQYDTSDAMTQMRIRAAHGRRFEDILGRLSQDHARLVKALILDFVLGDGVGAKVGEHGVSGFTVRWRGVVRATLGASCPRAPYEGKAVAAALVDLPQAMIDERRRRKPAT